MNKRAKAYQAGGSKSFMSLLRNPRWLFGTNRPQQHADMACVRRGESVEIAAFLRGQGPFRQGRIIIRANHADPVIWQHYRFPLGYREGKVMRAPYAFRSVAPVSGRGAWNINRARFRMLDIEADGEKLSVAVPAEDVTLLRNAITWIARKG